MRTIHVEGRSLIYVYRTESDHDNLGGKEKTHIEEEVVTLVFLALDLHRVAHNGHV